MDGERMMRYRAPWIWVAGLVVSLGFAPTASAQNFNVIAPGRVEGGVLH